MKLNPDGKYRISAQKLCRRLNEAMESSLLNGHFMGIEGIGSNVEEIYFSLSYLFCTQTSCKSL